MFMLFMSTCHVSELQPPTGKLFIPQIIYECGKPQWNDTDRGKVKNAERNMLQCHFVHHKSQTDLSFASD
jgi:hypothetical protein